MESLDDFLHHLLSRFNLETKPIYRKRMNALLKMKLGNINSSFKSSLSKESDVSGGIIQFGKG
jgi:hypothetical protein